MSIEEPKPKSFLTKIKEAVFKRGSVVFPEQAAQSTVYPEPNFQNMTNLFLGDPDVAASIEFISAVGVGGGFETTMNEKYTQKSDGKTAKEIVDDKCQEFGFDELIQEIAQDIIGWGNNFVWKGNSVKFEKCVRILPYWVQKVDFKDFKIQALHLQEAQDLPSEIDGKELVWLPFNRSGKDRLGVGLLQGLLTSYGTGGEIRPPFAQIKARVQAAMADQIENFSSYNEVWVFKGIPDAKVPEYNTKVQQMKKGRRITTNVEAEIVRSIPERMRGLDFYVETLFNSFYLGLKTPYAKLVLGGTFTEAAANAALVVGGFSTARLQRLLKRHIESEFFNKWVEEAGLDSKQAQIRLHWRLLRMPDMSVLMSLLTKLNELGTLKSPEIRKILIDMGLPIEKAEAVPAEPAAKPTVTAETPPLPQQPAISAEKKHEMTPREY